MHSLAIVRCAADAQLLAECRGLFLVAHRRSYPLRRKQPLLQIGAQQDTAEFTGAQYGEILVQEFRRHDGSIVTDAANAVNKRMVRPALQGKIDLPSQISAELHSHFSREGPA